MCTDDKKSCGYKNAKCLGMMENNASLLIQAQKGDKKARDKLVEINMGLVHHIVKRFANRGYEMQDLFQIGCIGLMKAIDKFDLSYEVQFSTYAVPMIMGTLKEVFKEPENRNGENVVLIDKKK